MILKALEKSRKSILTVQQPWTQQAVSKGRGTSWVKASSLLTWSAVMQGEDCGEGRRRGMSSVSGEGASEGERLR